MIEIITIGDELLCGRTQDTNAGMIARELNAAGFAVARITTTGDACSAISAALLACLRETRFVIVTGGLGPTDDDLTAATAADAFGDTIALHPEALEMLRADSSATRSHHERATTETGNAALHLHTDCQPGWNRLRICCALC